MTIQKKLHFLIRIQFHGDIFCITACIKFLTVTLLPFTRAYNKYLVLKLNIEQHCYVNSGYNKHR